MVKFSVVKMTLEKLFGHNLDFASPRLTAHTQMCNPCDMVQQAVVWFKDEAIPIFRTCHIHFYNLSTDTEAGSFFLLKDTLKKYPLLYFST